MGQGTRLRTHTCGALRANDAGGRVRLAGWVHRHRDKGGLIFIDLRDRYGIVQVALNAEITPSEVMARARRLRSEFVIGVEGTVELRPEEMRNPELPTGEVEVRADALEILNESEVLPFGLDSHDSASEDLRLEYRYLDLRRPELQDVLVLRHRVCQVTRTHLDREGFLEVETPMLVRPTPEGARDYLVPSRIRPGHFFALPQSPQLYKQILMVSGFDRYVQIARCMRDEDLRADRQPEFSQIDLEMSYITEEDIYELVEGLVAAILREARGITVETPFRRISFLDAMNRYGSDKPDTRFGLELQEVTPDLRTTAFRAFAEVIASGGVVKAMCVPARHALARRALEELESVAKRYGAKGLAWARVAASGLEGGVARFLSGPEAASVQDRLGAREGDTLLFVADRWRTTCTALGAVRLELGRRFYPPEVGRFELLWVNDFFLFEEGDRPGTLAPAHHVFTMPRPEDLPLLDTDPLRVRAQLYDLVLNGVELGSGSIRVHRRSLQEKLLALIGIDAAEAERRFGFLLRALQYGAPPHGGIALGVERIIMVLAGRSSIRDTIAFPKSTSAASLMDGAPAPVKSEELAELHLALREEERPRG